MAAGFGQFAGAEAEYRWHAHSGGLEAFVRKTGVDSLVIAACASASGCPARIWPMRSPTIAAVVLTRRKKEEVEDQQ
jgi:hypothetical protein